MQRTKQSSPLPHVTVKTVSRDSSPLRKVYVWEVPVRAVHWTIFLSIVILSFTGYYLHNPFIVVRGQGGYFLATMRFIHEVTAFVFTMAFLIRIYWAFVGNKYARWSAFIPTTRRQLRSIYDMLKYYLFLRWRAPSEVGHNSLAALAYVGIYVLFLIQILTGLRALLERRRYRNLAHALWLASRCGKHPDAARNPLLHHVHADRIHRSTTFTARGWSRVRSRTARWTASSLATST